MKKLCPVTLSIFALLFLFIAPPTQAEKVLKFSAVGSSGIVVVATKILKEAYDRLGYEIIVEPFPGQRALLFSTQGKVDGELFRNPKIMKKYKTLIEVSVPLWRTELSVFTRDLDIEVKGWESLKNYRILILRGHKLAEAKTRGMNVRTVTYFEEMFKALSRGGHLVGIGSRVSGLISLNERNSSRIRILEPPLERTKVFHYLHQKNAHLVPEIQRVLEAMEKSGLISKYQSDYIHELESSLK